MTDFKSQQEIWTWLVEGGEVASCYTAASYKFVDGDLKLFGYVDNVPPTFRRYDEWKKVIPWHENLTKPRLCWVWDLEETLPDKRNVALIENFSDDLFTDVTETDWNYATPLTDDEIRAFLSDTEVER